MNAFEMIADQPWAIAEPALRTIVEVARRENLDPRLVEAIRGEPLDNTRTVTVRGGVARVPITGPIFRHANLFTRISGATSTATIATDFRAALDDPAIVGVVLDIDSPGGEAKGIGELAEQVRAARGVKPVVAYISGAGQSAAYWIASAADEVVVASTAMVGSIGALVAIDRRPDGEKEPLVIVSSQSPDKYHDPESVRGQTKIQATIDSLAAVFVAEVAANRGVTPEHVLAHFGRGGSFVGREAVQAGLADALGSLEGVTAALAAGARTNKKGGATAPAGNRPPALKGAKMSQEDNQNDPRLDEIEQLKRQLAAATEDKAAALAAAAKAVDDRIEAAAESFVQSVTAGRGATAVPAERQAIKAAFAMFARDDHANPVAGSPAARQDAYKAAFGRRRPHDLTDEVGAGDEASKARALGSDPANDAKPDPADKEFDDDITAYVGRVNPKKS